MEKGVTGYRINIVSGVRVGMGSLFMTEAGGK